MARLIKMSYDGPGNLQELVARKARPTINERFNAAKKDFDEAVSGAVEVGRVALRTNTPQSVFPNAANPPERRLTGDMFARFDSKYDHDNFKHYATVGWRSPNYRDYFGYQEEGFMHVGGRFVRGVNALEFAKQEFIRDMRRRGYTT